MTPKPDSKSITILGAGVTGVTSAYLLARAGYQVTVLERESDAGMGTSAENGAQLSYGFADPISSPATLRRMPAIVTGRDPGISVHARHLLAHPLWSIAFLRNCLARRSQANTSVMTRLALYSREVMAEIRGETGIDFDFTYAGRLVLYADPGALASCTKAIELRNQDGCDLELLSREQCLALDESLSNWSEPIAGGIYSRSDEVGDAGAWCRALAKYCSDHLGVQFKYACKVTGFERQAESVSAVRTAQGEIPVNKLVVCLGSQSPAIQSQLGLRLPILPLKGYSLTIAATDTSPNISIASAEHRIVFARLGERIRIAGLAHVRGSDLTKVPEHVDAIRKDARQLFPGAGNHNAVLSTWCGLRPLTPDGLPLIGATRLANVFLNTGHGGLGWTLAAGSGALLTAIIDGSETRKFSRKISSHQIAAFSKSPVGSASGGPTEVAGDASSNRSPYRMSGGSSDQSSGGSEVTLT